MTKKVPKNILRIERNFSWILEKSVFGRPRRAAPPPPPIFLDRRRAAAADRNWPARRRRHNDVGAQLYLPSDNRVLIKQILGYTY